MFKFFQWVFFPKRSSTLIPDIFISSIIELNSNCYSNSQITNEDLFINSLIEDITGNIYINKSRG